MKAYFNSVCAMNPVKAGIGADCWVAKIIGYDSAKREFKLKFCSKEKNLSNSGKTGEVVFSLFGDGYYMYRGFNFGSTQKHLNKSGICEIRKEVCRLGVSKRVVVDEIEMRKAGHNVKGVYECGYLSQNI